MSNPSAGISEVIAQTLGSAPPLLPVTYNHLAAPDTRDDIVPNRLAVNVGPLLGVPYPEGPVGSRSWLGDYSKLTLSEIGQGAPRDALDDNEHVDQPARIWGSE